MRALAVAAAWVATATLAACSSSTGASPSPARGACVSQTEAEAIWNRVDQRLNAVVLDPKHAGLSDVATGNALASIEQYIQTTLVQPGLTEREVDRLDQLIILNPGCAGAPLHVHVTMTVLRDDYLKAGGALDHSDPAAGKALRLDETFVRAGSAWKESDFQSLDQQGSQTPQLVVARGDSAW